MRVSLFPLAAILALAGLMQLVLGHAFLGATLIILAGAMIPLQVRGSRQFKEYDRRKAMDDTFRDG